MIDIPLQIRKSPNWRNAILAIIIQVQKFPLHFISTEQTGLRRGILCTYQLGYKIINLFQKHYKLPLKMYFALNNLWLAFALNWSFIDILKYILIELLL